MNPKYKQRGSTLIVALIMLVVLTLLVISAMRSSNTNLRIAGNMQMQEEAVAAAQQGIENVISFNFASNPAAANVNVDINNDGVTDYIVNIPAPICIGSTPLTNNTANLPHDCISSAAAQNTGIMSASGVGVGNGGGSTSWCNTQQWEVIANAVSASTGATATVRQGVSINIPTGQQPCTFVPAIPE